MKKWTLLVALLAALAGCSTEETGPIDEAASSQAQFGSESEKAEEVVQPDIPTKEEMAFDFEDVMEENFAGVSDVYYIASEKTYYFIPTQEEFVAEITYAYAYPDSKQADDWYEMVYQMTLVSESIYDALGPGYSIVFVNPVNDSLQYLHILDGQVVYEAVGDQ